MGKNIPPIPQQGKYPSIVMADMFSKMRKKEPEKALVDTTKKVSSSSIGVAGMTELENELKKRILSFDPNEPWRTAKEMYATVFKTVEEVANNTPETRIRDAANLRAKERSLGKDKLIATLLTAAGVQGGAQLLAAANDSLYTTRYMASQIEHNPTQFYAMKKAEVYQAAGQYLQGLAMMQASRPDVSGMITGLANVFNTKSQSIIAGAEASKAASSARSVDYGIDNKHAANTAALGDVYAKILQSVGGDVAQANTIFESMKREAITLGGQ